LIIKKIRGDNFLYRLVSIIICVCPYEPFEFVEHFFRQFIRADNFISGREPSLWQIKEECSWLQRNKKILGI